VDPETLLAGLHHSAEPKLLKTVLIPTPISIDTQTRYIIKSRSLRNRGIFFTFNRAHHDVSLVSSLFLRGKVLNLAAINIVLLGNNNLVNNFFPFFYRSCS
jgi:hypothetical protein